MDESNRDVLHEYLKNIVSLYSMVKEWLSEKTLVSKEIQHTIIEEASGSYNTNKMSIIGKDNTQIAEIVPIGAWTIGAKGRVDLIGDYDQQVLIYLTSELVNSVSSKQLYKGVENSGWYWIEDNRRAKAHLINKELFFELLEEVSDNEF